MIKKSTVFLFLFVIAVSSFAQKKPLIIGPVHSFETIIRNPSFSWKMPSSNDCSVQIQLAKDEKFTKMVDEDTIHSVVDWYVPAQALSIGIYWWRIRSLNDQGATSLWSESRRFTIIQPKKTFIITPHMSAAEVIEISKKASIEESALIKFEKGEYHFHIKDNSSIFQWEGISNIIVDGGGSLIIMENPATQFYTIIDCENIMIGNFTYTYEPIQHTITKVIESQPEKGYIDVEIIDGFSEEKFPITVNQFFSFGINTEDSRRTHAERPDCIFLDPNKSEKINKNTIRYYVQGEYLDENESGAKHLSKMKQGDMMAVAYRMHPFGYIQRCKNSTLYNICALSSEAAIYSGGGNIDLKILNLSSKSKKGIFPTPPGWVGGNDRHGPWIDGGNFEAFADDGPNMTGNIFMPKSQITSKRFVLKTAISWQNPAWIVGDTLQFWNPISGLPIGTTTIKKVFTTSDEIKQGIHQVEISDVIEGVELGMDMATSTHVYNLSCNNNNLVARNNKIDVSRRFGFFIKSRNVLVEKNHFSNLAASAIYFENIPAFWEGNASENVVVQHNLIENCSNTYKSFKNGCASGVTLNLQRYPGDPSNKDYETPWRGHKNFLIRYNEIVDWEYCGISVDNAENVEIYENTFKNKSKNNFMKDENIAISIGENVKNVTVGNNRYLDKRKYVKVSDKNESISDKYQKAETVKTVESEQ